MCQSKGITKPLHLTHLIFPYKAILGIASVRDAIKRYSPNDHTLTPIHYCLIQVKININYYLLCIII